MAELGDILQTEIACRALDRVNRAKQGVDDLGLRLEWH
jgi:hypothetical protein